MTKKQTDQMQVLLKTAKHLREYCLEEITRSSDLVKQIESLIMACYRVMDETQKDIRSK